MNENESPGRPLPDSEPMVSDRGTPPGFIPRAGTYILLFFLLIIYPLFGLAEFLLPEYEIDWDSLNLVLTVYLPTIIPLWLLFVVVMLGLWREKSSLGSIGFTPFRPAYILHAIGFVIAANLTLFVLQSLLAAVGLTMSQAVEDLVERAGESMWWWGALSVTAAVCEEVAFRGYVMTRIRGLYDKGGWIVPSLLSAVAFSAGHSYQGAAGMILMFVYGLMFCWLFLRTRSIWPCILAHFIQDFSAIFIYRLYNS